MKPLLFFFFLIWSFPAHAFELKITSKSGEIIDSYGSERLKSLGTKVIETSTPWTSGLQVFNGVPATVLLDEVAPNSEIITAAALNDYIIEVPVEILRRTGAIVAFELNGESMLPITKGPFWIIFDFDDLPLEQHTEIRRYSVWHLSELQIDE